MSLKSKSLLAITLIAITLLGSSCDSLRRIVGNDSTVANKASDQLLSDVLEAEIDYRTISTKGSVELKKGKSGKKVAAVYKLVKDSVIQVSIRPILGFEVFRITFTPDNITVIDRLKKQYFADNFSNMMKSKNIDFNFYNLQAILTNKLFVPGKKNTEKKHFKSFDMISTDKTHMLSTLDNNKLFYTFAINASDRITSTSIQSKKHNINIDWAYSDFVSDGNFVYPQLMSALLTMDKQQIEININFSKLEIDKNMQVDTSIPSNYNKISAQELAASYINLK